MKVLSSNKFKSESVISENVSISGSIQGEGNLTIEGKFSGELEITGKLSLVKNAHIDANIKAKELSIDCKMQGNIDTQSLELLSQSSLDGNLTVNEIKIEEGARFNGFIDMDFDLPTEI